ncbi:hypothetical protein BST28_18625 [Mycolicibacter kumamotonensis]|uniref:Uncharacterized protein n=1 Tax=Mycolicibacter kumamotonensis TaxID=354243 RepID=A0A1X0DYA2_9MYCO|nr:hypothetical protein [Mycolicibacter kumamotonensis]ORA77281.1 hypothetical protein BST28_18625 [Mycolicibacter kumamotonensis]
MTFTTDTIALAIELPGVYDGTSVYLLKDGTFVNRWTNSTITHRRWAADEWIAAHGDKFRAANADLLDKEEEAR